MILTETTRTLRQYLTPPALELNIRLNKKFYTLLKLLSIRIDSLFCSSTKFLPNRGWKSRGRREPKAPWNPLYKRGQYASNFDSYFCCFGRVYWCFHIEFMVWKKSLIIKMTWNFQKKNIRIFFERFKSTFLVLLSIVIISGVLLNAILFTCTMYNSAITTAMIGVSKSTLTSFIGLFCFDGMRVSHTFL